MRLIDFIIQTLLVVIAMFAGAMFWFSPEMIRLSIGCQFILFFWQLAGAVISLLTGSAGVEIKRKYLLLIIIYIVSVVLIPALTSGLELPVLLTRYTLYILIPVWSLLLFYYYVTCRIAFIRKNKGNFLRHLSF